jgi:hypothetical protein
LFQQVITNFLKSQNRRVVGESIKKGIPLVLLLTLSSSKEIVTCDILIKTEGFKRQSIKTLLPKGGAQWETKARRIKIRVGNSS